MKDWPKWLKIKKRIVVLYKGNTMETVYLHWNITNWITVVLMVAIGFMALALFSQFWKNRMSVAA